MAKNEIFIMCINAVVDTTANSWTLCLKQTIFFFLKINQASQTRNRFRWNNSRMTVFVFQLCKAINSKNVTISFIIFVFLSHWKGQLNFFNVLRYWRSAVQSHDELREWHTFLYTFKSTKMNKNIWNSAVLHESRPQKIWNDFLISNLYE